MKLIGIGGTNGSGKDTLGEFLAERGWLFVSVSDILRDEARRRGLPIERQVLRTISAEWRRQYGLGVLVDKAVAQFNKAGGKYKGLVAIPMRNPGEADEIHKLGGTVVWLDAEPKIRYQRIYSRGRSAEDDKTFAQFLSEEKAEMEHTGDHATLSLAGVRDRADIVFYNDSNNVGQFQRVIEEALAAYL